MRPHGLFIGGRSRAKMFTELCHNFFGFRKCSGRRLCVHLDEEDGVDVKRRDWDVFYVGGKLWAHVGGGGDLVAQVERRCKEMEEQVASMKTPIPCDPGYSGQVEYQTSALGLWVQRSNVNSINPRSITFLDTGLQDHLVRQAEVYETQLVVACQTDASNAGHGRRASSKEKRALGVHPPRDVDGPSESPALPQHGHKLARCHGVRAPGAVERGPI